MITETTSRETCMNEIVGYIKTLVGTPSPTGFTGNVIEFLAENAKSKGIPFEITRKGAILYKFESEKPGKNVMLSVHVDTLGAIVRKVDNDAVKFSCVGGYPPEYVVGNYCTIHTFAGEKITGTILPANPSVHVNKDLKEKKFKMEDLSVRVDIKLKDKDDKFENYIKVGNFISFDPGFSHVNGFVKSRHLDDKASAGILLHIADIFVEKMKDPGFSFKNNYYFFFNITEETGQGIAGFPNIDDLLVVDMGAIGEDLSGDEFSVSICAKDTTGPYHYEFTRELVKICEDNEIPYKMDVFPFYGSDASGALISGQDIRTALVGAGIGASHGYERTHEDSLMGVFNLLMKYMLG